MIHGDVFIKDENIQLSARLNPWYEKRCVSLYISRSKKPGQPDDQFLIHLFPMTREQRTRFAIALNYASEYMREIHFGRPQ